MGAMTLQTFAVGLIQGNCSIVGCPETREAAVIDPGEEGERILDLLARQNLSCTMILLTHAHIDHVGAAATISRATGAPIHLHEADLPLYEHVPDQAALFGFPAPPMIPVSRYLTDGELLRIGRLTGEVRHTPGHSPGGVCFYFAGDGGQDPPRVFSGDTLFAGSIGRTDLWGGDHGTLLRSIRTRLFTLPERTVVIAGHGEETTIGREMRSNPFLLEDREE
jgi:hydroxyacylglutathione hydrolase